MKRFRIPRFAILGALIALLAAPVAFGALAPQPGQRIDLKVLLISATGQEPTFGAWKAQLDREGVPYDTIVADAADGAITDAKLADYSANWAKYQAVILATGELKRPNPANPAEFVTALNPDEWAALDRFELTFGIRRISDATEPAPAHGLNLPTAVGAAQDGNTGTVTAAGAQVFPYLQTQVPIDNSTAEFTEAFGWVGTPVAGATFQTLVTGPNNTGAYLGINTRPDGREEMVMTVDSNQFQSHAQLLRHGMLNWVTRGYYFGTQRNYFEMHVDDVFLPNDRWDTTANKTGVEGDGTAPGTGSDPTEYQCTREVADPTAPPSTLPQCPPLIRMTAQDVADAIAWQNRNGVVLDMAFNGGGADEWRAENAGADPLEDAFLANKGAFGWINHTFTHPNLNTAPQSVIEDEIRRNQQWATARALPYDSTELVTGEHSAVGTTAPNLPTGSIPQNPALAPALAATGINWIASDNSRELNGSQRAIGPALTIPRYPSNIYYNVATMAEQLDEYNYIYVTPGATTETTGCVPIPNVTTCRTTLATEADYVAAESGIMFGHLMGNDPRPHYVHQSNITGDKILYRVLDPLLARYRQYFKPPLIQLSQKQTALELARQTNWKTLRAGGQVSAYLLDGQIHIQNRSTSTVEIPFTGISSIGSDYGGTVSGWTTIAPTSEITKAAPALGQSVSRGTQSKPQAGKPQAGKPKSKVRKLRLSKVTMKPKSFSRTSKKGSMLSWKTNRATTLRLSIERTTPGKRVGVTCRKPTKRLAKRKPCNRYVPSARINRKVAAGNGRLRITAKVGKRTLRRGSYRLRAVLTDGKGNSSPVRIVKFSVKR